MQANAWHSRTSPGFASPTPSLAAKHTCKCMNDKKTPVWTHIRTRTFPTLLCKANGGSIPTQQPCSKQPQNRGKESTSISLQRHWWQEWPSAVALAALTANLLLASPTWAHTTLEHPHAATAYISDRATTVQHTTTDQYTINSQHTQFVNTEYNSNQVVDDIASEVEDKLLEVVRQLEARMDSALGAVMQAGPRLPFDLGAASSPEEVARVNETAHALISEVWEVVDLNYLDARSTGWDRQQWQRLRDEALARNYNDISAAYRAIREMMAWGLSDPYCRFITPSELSAMKKYDVTGVGLNLGTGEEYTLKTGRPLPQGRPATDSGVFVVGLSKGSPADKVGIVQGDELLEVDGQPLTQSTPFQAASLIAGTHTDGDGASSSHKGYVELKVRKTDGMTSTLRVDRPVRTFSSPVSASLSKSGSEPAGIIHLTSFNARAQRDLAAAIKRLQDQGAKSLILDLRDNRGGLVSEGLEVARLFLEEGSPIVYTESRNMTADAPRATGMPLTTLPLFVLVNEHTASASEIVAGALHDNCRAVLVGSRTYGKGLIQSVYELSDGSGLVLTVGKYLTPNRTDIDLSGIQPDFSSKPSPRLAAETLEACLVDRQQRSA